MKSTIVASVFGLGIAVFASPALAEFEIYKCNMTNKGRGGFVGDIMLLGFDPDTGEASVYDATVYLADKKEVAAKLSRRSDTSWRFKYRVEDVQTGNSGSNAVNMSAVLYLKSKTVSVNGQLVGYDNSISGSGTCERVE